MLHRNESLRILPYVRRPTKECQVGKKSQHTQRLEPGSGAALSGGAAVCLASSLITVCSTVHLTSGVRRHFPTASDDATADQLVERNRGGIGDIEGQLCGQGRQPRN